MKDSSGLIPGMALVIFLFGVVEFIGMIGGGARDDIYVKHVEQAIEVCENNGGLYKIEGESFGYHVLICKNGAVFTYTPPKTDEAQ